MPFSCARLLTALAVVASSTACGATNVSTAPAARGSGGEGAPSAQTVPIAVSTVAAPVPSSPALAPTPPVIAAHLSVAPTQFDDVCPAPLEFSGAITSSAPGVVTYRWESSDGGTRRTQTMRFESPGTTNVHESWHVGGGHMKDRLGMWLHVLTPVEIESEHAMADIACHPFPPLPPQPSFKIKSVTLRAPLGAKRDTCPNTFVVGATIEAVGSGTVQYVWEYGDSYARDPQRLAFAGTGAQDIEVPWYVPGPGKAHARLRVIQPNAVMSNEIEVSQECARSHR